MTPCVLNAVGITKQYGQRKALDNLNINIKQGDIYGLIGTNGAGKTTLIRIITALVHRTAGELSLFGKTSPKDLVLARKRIGAIVDRPVFFQNLTAIENLEYYRLQRGIPDKKTIHRVLDTVSFTDNEKKYKHLSQGMRQRMGLALAIMGKPDFLILDEPINALDPVGIIEFRNILNRLHEENNMTILLSSHFLSELTQVATYYGIIHNGHLVKEFSKTKLELDTKRYVSVNVSDATKAAIIFEEKISSVEYKVFPNNELRIYSPSISPSDIAYYLVGGGVRLNALIETNSGLEDYFMQAVGNTYEEDGL